MDREKALELLRGGEGGVKEWNRRWDEGEAIPDLSGAVLSDAKLKGVDLSGTDLSRANLNGANLRGANLCDAKLCGVDLKHADLGGANLLNANLGGANLAGAKLWAADLRGANVSKANLSGANLRHAQLGDADLRNTRLKGANLQNANLDGADLSGAELRRAKLCDAIVGWTTFASVDLGTTKGLDTLTHRGPSSIGLDTLQKSGPTIPDSFLTGCGVNDDWLAFIRPMLRMHEPFAFYSCFISYSHQDEEFTKRLYSRMRQDSMQVWYAPEDMKAGRKIHEQIDSAIRLHDKLLVVLSKHSMQSEWVANEIREAFKREKQEDRRVLFPISLVPFEAIKNWKLIDSRTGTDLAEEIRQYFIPDFTNWKEHDAFEATYQRLMKDFKPAPDDK